MFQILASGIQESYEELASQIRKRHLLIADIENVVKTLSAVSGMEEFTDQLNRQLTILESQQRSYIQMMQALNLVLTYYQECENRIMSKSELGDGWSFEVAFKENDFSRISGELKSIKLK